jgi:hypothetical protein
VIRFYFLFSENMLVDLDIWDGSSLELELYILVAGVAGSGPGVHRNLEKF